MISRLDHNCLDKFLNETQDQDTTFETKAVTLKTKTKTVKILSRDKTLSRDLPSLHIGHIYLLKYVGIFYILRSKITANVMKNVYHAFVHSYMYWQYCIELKCMLILTLHTLIN